MVTASEATERLIEKASNDSTFRDQLIADPGKTVEEEFGITLPDGFSIEVHEQSAKAAHLVLPPSGRLGEEDLAAVAGAGGCWPR